VDAEGFPRLPDDVSIAVSGLKGELARARTDAVEVQQRVDEAVRESLPPPATGGDGEAERGEPTTVVAPPTAFCTVASVTPSSTAAEAGVRVGDRVARVGAVCGSAGEAATATLARVPDAVRATLGAGKRCIIIVDRGERRELIPVTPATPGVASPLGAVLEPIVG
jgi:hypothetical protein